MIEHIKLIPGGVVSYVIYNGESNWYYCSIQKWLMDSWSQWNIDMTAKEDAICEEFISKLLTPCKVTEEQLKAAIQMLLEEKKNIRASFLKPKVVVDFDRRMLFSEYFDTPVETSVLSSWIGDYRQVVTLIPLEKHYWKEMPL